MDTKEESAFENVWLALDLLRNDQEFSAYYLKDLIDTIITKEGVLHTGRGDYTNYAKVTLLLTAYGIDASDVAGYNLIERISALPIVQQQGVNGVIYALLALDSGNYEIQPPASLPITITRESYINSIIKSQLSDGGWDWADKQADPDMTAMAIQALAPYYDSNENAKVAIDKALQTLSNLQQPNGGFLTEDANFEESSESSSMVILALTALEIDPAADARFIKNSLSPIDNLCSFAKDGGFTHTMNGAYNILSTDQGYRALVAYHRLLEGKTSFYDMSDVGELQNVSSSLSPQVIVSYYDDPSLIGDDISMIENSSVLTDIDGKIDLFVDLQLVLADDNGTVFANLAETDEEMEVSLIIPEEILSDLGDKVIVIGLHNGELLTIDPYFVDRTTGEVKFKASQFSTYAVVSGTAPTVEPSTEEETTPSQSENIAVKTGDDSMMALWIVLIIVSALGITAGIIIHLQSVKKRS